MYSNITKLTLSTILAAGFGMTTLAFSRPASAADQVLKVAYSSDYVPLTPEAGVAAWAAAIDTFEKANPGVKVETIKIPGSYADVMNKLGLLFRSSSTAPDVAEISNFDMVQWIDSGYLMDITANVAEDPSWKGMPESIRSETTSDGKVYAISHGEGEFGLLYDKALFQKAGIPLPWDPKTWDEVFDAARKIKASSPSVWPLWLPTGTAQGSSGAAYGPSNLLVGSSDPAIYDTASNKWVVDSKGIREVVDAYRTAAAEGLLAPASQMLNATAIATPPTEIPKHNIGITLAGEWFSIQWLKEISAPYYPDAFKEIGLTKVPTKSGQAPGFASTLGGWDLAIYSGSKQKDLAWKFIQTYQSKANLLRLALANGWTPPVTAIAEDPAWTSLDPFQATFNKIVPIATGIPVKSGYTTWSIGFLTATEAVVLDPKLSVDDAMQKMNDYVTNQLGADAVEVKH